MPASVRFATKLKFDRLILAVMVAECVSLGILSLPSAMAALGLLPYVPKTQSSSCSRLTVFSGLLLIIILGILATYSGYVIGQFKLRYPATLSMADAGERLFGKIGREIFGIGSVLSLVLIQGAHILTWTVAMDEITDHATCNIHWGILGTVISFVVTLPRTLKKQSYFSIACKSFLIRP